MQVAIGGATTDLIWGWNCEDRFTFNFSPFFWHATQCLHNQTCRHVGWRKSLAALTLIQAGMLRNLIRTNIFSIPCLPAQVDLPRPGRRSNICLNCYDPPAWDGTWLVKVRFPKGANLAHPRLLLAFPLLDLK